ncbi:hypothetical protein LMH73_008715 [Vibrio splendidus]|nr:hypothetical protein [Vibrio splendidus]MCC4879451.1 hypothetical protein [Vibrio splendidus]
MLFYFNALVVKGEFGLAILGVSGNENIDLIREDVRETGHEEWLSLFVDMDKKETGGYSFEVQAKVGESEIEYALKHEQMFIQQATPDDEVQANVNKGINSIH